MQTSTKYKFGFSVATVAAGLTMALIANVGSTVGVASAKPPATTASTTVKPPATAVPATPSAPTTTATAAPQTTVTVTAPEPTPVDAVGAGLVQFIGALWTDHYGARFTLGNSGISATLAGASANGEEIPTDLIKDLEASGLTVLRRWNLQVSSEGKVAAEATFTETSRVPLVGLSNTAAELQAGKIDSLDRFVVSGYSRNAAGGVRDLFGIVVEIRRADGSSGVYFTPTGGAAGSDGAVEGAAKFAARFPQGKGDDDVGIHVVRPDPVVDADVKAICDERRETCEGAASLRNKSCRKSILAHTLVCIGGCPVAAMACTVGYIACFALCEAGCMAYEVIQLSACDDVYHAEILQCDQQYRDCIRNGGK